MVYSQHPSKPGITSRLPGANNVIEWFYALGNAGFRLSFGLLFHSRTRANFSRRIYMTISDPIARFATAITRTLDGVQEHAGAGTVGSMFKQ